MYQDLKKDKPSLLAEISWITTFTNILCNLAF